MSMTREDVMRELELLPVWTLRAPLPTQSAVESKQPITEAAVVEQLAIEVPIVTESPALLIASEDKKWVFVLPAELSAQAADLFNNILRALHINKTQTSHSQQLAPDIAILDAGVIVAMGEAMAQQLLTSTESIESLRGKVHVVNGLQVIATYHPDELLQSPANNAPNKAKTWDDLCRALDVVSN